VRVDAQSGVGNLRIAQALLGLRSSLATQGESSLLVVLVVRVKLFR
jgi:hypothetical protein